MSRPLTLAEAQDRARLLRVDSYDLELDLTRGQKQFLSRTVVRFACNEVGASSFVELQATAVISATLNGVAVSDWQDGRLELIDLQTDNELVVDADLPYVSTGEGMHRYVDPLDGQVYVGAYLGVDNAQKVFACFDQPDLKATFTATVLAPEGWTVLGNGVVTDGVMARTPRISTYLFVVLAGPFHSVVSGRFGLHTRRSLAAALEAEAPEILAITRACFDRYAELFDEPYPYDSYDQAFVPELNWGAMESPGCVTFRDSYVFRTDVTEAQREDRGMVIAHEMAHMWFGNLVTMRWWDDLWLSESFAEYMGYQVLSEVSRFTDTWTSFSGLRKVWGYDSDQRPSTHPIAADAEDVLDTQTALANFDGISYAKGASALRQLVAWIGREAFLAGINAFLTRHRFANATLADLLEALSQASGEDVHGWADAWLRTSGVDTIGVERQGTGLTVTHPGLRPHLVTIGVYDDKLTLTESLEVMLPEGQPTVTVTAAEGLVVVNDGDLTFAKTRTDARSLDSWTDGLGRLPDSLTRAVAWCELRDRVRDGELNPSEWVGQVLRHLPGEDAISLVQGVLAFTRVHVLDRYLDPTLRPAAMARLAQACRALQSSSAPDVRLEGTRTLVAVTTADEVSALLASTSDQDLRWRMLLRLSVLDVVGEAELSAELASDASGSGPTEVARCRAAQPTGKDAAWKAMFGEREVSTYLVQATASGFWRPEHADLLTPFVSRWFPAAVAVTTRRGASVASAIGFPFHTVEQSTLEAGLTCLDGNPPAPLRRQLVDQLDDYRRALRVRASLA